MNRLRNVSIIGVTLMLIACSGSSDTNIDGTQVVEPKAAEIKGLAKAAFGGVAFASTQVPAVHGGYAKGCLAGGVELPAHRRHMASHAPVAQSQLGAP